MVGEGGVGGDGDGDERRERERRGILKCFCCGVWESGGKGRV